MSKENGPMKTQSGDQIVCEGQMATLCGEQTKTLTNKLWQRWGGSSSDRIVYLACTMPWVQSPLLKKLGMMAHACDLSKRIGSLRPSSMTILNYTESQISRKLLATILPSQQLVLAWLDSQLIAGWKVTGSLLVGPTLSWTSEMGMEGGNGWKIVSHLRTRQMRNNRWHGDLFRIVNKDLWKEAMSGCNKKLEGVCVCRGRQTDWNFSTVERLELCGFRGELLHLGLVLPFWDSHASPHSVSDLTPHNNKYKPPRSN